MKIAFTGAESTGKTTLLRELQGNFPDLVPIEGVTRNVKNYLNKSNDVQKNILASYAATLMEHAKTGFICDRTIFDVCAYSIVKEVWDYKYVDSVLTNYVKTNIFPDYLFYTPIEFPMVQDGGRPEGTREAIDAEIKRMIDKYADNEYITLTGGVEKRVETILRAIRK